MGNLHKYLDFEKFQSNCNHFSLKIHADASFLRACPDCFPLLRREWGSAHWGGRWQLFALQPERYGGRMVFQCSKCLKKDKKRTSGMLIALMVGTGRHFPAECGSGFFW